MKNFALARAAVVVGAALIGLPAAASYSNLYVFGDSLSDNGNLFALTGGASPPPPYFQGRFSNGPVAVEVLASGLGATLHDLAVAGAQTSTLGVFPNSGMTSQLASFTAGLNGGSADPNALYFVWGGANDLRAAGVNAAAAIAPTIVNLSTIVSSLYSLGARNFMLPNLPNLGLTPESIESGLSGSAGAVSSLFNTHLALTYSAMASSMTDENFIYFDAFAAQTALVNGVGSNGYTDVTHRCFDTRDLAAITLCATPATYLYWDNIHPTAAAHAALGAQMLAVAAPVPEPSTTLMMAAGVLLLLGIGRRKQG